MSVLIWVLVAAGVILGIIISIFASQIRLELKISTVVGVLVVSGVALVLVTVLHDRQVGGNSQGAEVQSASTVGPTPAITSSAASSSTNAPSPTAIATSSQPSLTTTPPPATGTPLGTAISGTQFLDSDLLVTRTSNGADEVELAATDLSINGMSAASGWTARCVVLCSSQESGYVEINLGRKFTTLEGIFGVSDRSQGDGPVTIEVDSLDGGGTVLFKQSFTRSSGAPQSISVAGVLTLRVTFTGPLLTAKGAVGSPTLY